MEFRNLQEKLEKVILQKKPESMVGITQKPNLCKVKRKKNHCFLYMKKTKQQTETIITRKDHILVIDAFIYCRELFYIFFPIGEVEF